ncbi:hypothetical protein OC861_005969 [Tilletia horrida]|nr:hypothetical protein OC861_005969 [Tilletia horrida]
MSRPGISGLDQDPFFYIMKASGVIDQPVFSFALSHGESQLTLGGMDSTRYEGPIEWVPVEGPAGGWRIVASLAGVTGLSILFIYTPVPIARQIFDSLDIDTITEETVFKLGGK